MSKMTPIGSLYFGETMTQQRFELLEHTADIILRAYGKSKEELFENAAYGTFSVIGEPSAAKPEIGRPIKLAADDVESLLIAWLSDLLYLFETSEIFFCQFECHISDSSLAAVARGENFSAEKHQFKTEIKAVTHHALKVEQKDGQWVAEILLDL
jgi:SHS2 domain-containing protein